MTFDLLIRNARLFNSAYKVFYEGYLTVLDGRLYHTLPGDPPGDMAAKIVIDAAGKHVVPGLIDVHMHIESSMVTPVPFGYHLATRGVTTIVAEPHEIANVMGIEGIRAMLRSGEGAPIDIFFGIPSSVPSTDATLETTGGVIGLEELAELLHEPGVACLGEVMNTRAVIGDADSTANRFIRLVKEQAPHLPIEGHCPRIVGEDLCRYIYMGVDSDHTEHTLEEVRQRYFLGMCVQLQHKMMRPEIIGHVIDNDLFESTCLVTDDVMADKLVREGHLDAIVRQAIALGFSPEQAIYCATATPAARMALADRGRLRPGLLADLVILEDLDRFEVDKTFKAGRLVYDRAEGYRSPEPSRAFPENFYRTVHLAVPTLADFTLPCDRQGPVNCRVIVVNPERTQTAVETVSVPVRDGYLDWQASGRMLAAVFERHGKTDGGRGYGLMGGSMLSRGAVATTYAHDHHNLLVVGASPEDMQVAAAAVIRSGGGLACAENGTVTALVELPVAGLLSEKPITQFAVEVERLTAEMERLGYRHISPIMSLCTTSLPVSPALKITDRGLVDVLAGKIVPLIVD